MENKQREEESAFLLVEDLEEQERVVSTWRLGAAATRIKCG